MPQELGAGKPARVLLVQDDPRATMMISELLRAVWRAGLVICHTPSMADAGQELVDHGATCVLLDVAAEPSPVNALAQLSSAAPHTPIIVLVDRDDADFGVEAIRAGAQDVLVKDELKASVLGRATRLAIERKRAEAALALQALHDPLTSLPNRALFLDRLRVAMDRSRRTGAPVVVMFLDVDGFKQINDTLGHSAGDLVLTVLAGRFGRLLRPMDTVARFGGDEFTFLFEGLEGEAEAALVAQRISESARQPLSLADTQMSVAVSIGVAIVRDPEAALEETVRRADTAMYRAKELGGARFELYGERSSLGAAPDLEPDLRGALDRRELRVHYQPCISLAGKTGLVGFEALVRWDHPERGLIEPGDFMTLAEETGLIVPIGEWVLEQALHQVRRFRESRPEVTVSVNLSPRQLKDPGLLDRLSAAIRRGGHDPGALCLEVPEAALAAEPQVTTRQLAALNEIGVQLAIDDFGTGHAAPADLQRMPVHILKIDRTLVSRLTRDPGDAAGISAAVELGHALGLSVVAAGVETDAQLAALRDLGCDGAQGYLFSRPMPEEGLHSLLGTR